MVHNPSCIDYSKVSDKKYKKIQIGGNLLRKSINTCKNKAEKQGRGPNTTNIKEATHFYKRVIAHNPDKEFSTKKLKEYNDGGEEE